MKPIISRNIRMRNPGLLEIGAYSIIDDFCYISTQVRVGVCSHIASGCSIAGGKEQLFELGDFCSLSSGVKIWCGSDDFTRDLVTIIPSGFPSVKKHFIAGNVSLADYTAVGSNSVVMPDNRIPEGTVIGALSFVPPRFPFKPWSVYAGAPVRYLRKRDKRAVLLQAKALRAEMAKKARK